MTRSELAYILAGWLHQLKGTNMKTYAKAITAAIVAGLGSLAVAAADNSIVLGEAIGAASVAAAAFGAVYGIRNGEG